MGYDDLTGVCMVYLAAHVGFAGAMLNPFTIGIAQDMSGLALFSGIEYRTLCWLVLMFIAIAFVLWYASRIRKPMNPASEHSCDEEKISVSEDAEEKGSVRAWICMGILTVVLVLFSIFYASDCVIKIGQSSYHTPWLLWACTVAYFCLSLYTLKLSTKMFILGTFLFSIVFLIVGVMGYGWYLPEICALFLAMAIAVGFAAGYSADKIAGEFLAGAKDIFSAALIIGFAAGIIVILKNGDVIDILLNAMASGLDGSGKLGALTSMYGIQTFINLFIPSATAKAAVTIPIMAPYSDLIGLSRQATVLAFQFGDGFTNMITPCSGVLMAVLSVAKISYEKWFRFIWKFILFLLFVGFLLLLPTIYFELSGF